MSKSKFVLTPSREKEIKIVEWFIPTNCKWNHPDMLLSDSTIGIVGIDEAVDGTSPEEAYFCRSERGKFPLTVRDKSRLRSLLWGKVWRERSLSEIWKDGVKEGTCLPQDFLDEPDYIRGFIFPRVFGLPPDWKPGV